MQRVHEIDTDIQGEFILTYYLLLGFKVLKSKNFYFNKFKNQSSLLDFLYKKY